MGDATVGAATYGLWLGGSATRVAYVKLASEPSCCSRSLAALEAACVEVDDEADDVLVEASVVVGAAAAATTLEVAVDEATGAATTLLDMVVDADAASGPEIACLFDSESHHSLSRTVRYQSVWKELLCVSGTCKRKLCVCAYMHTCT